MHRPKKIYTKIFVAFVTNMRYVLVYKKVWICTCICVWHIQTWNLSKKLPAQSFWGQKFRKNCVFCDNCQFATKVPKWFDMHIMDWTNEKLLFFTLYCLFYHLYRILHSKCVNINSMCLNLHHHWMKLRRKGVNNSGSP